jgi:translocation and assembly module TamB
MQDSMLRVSGRADLRRPYRFRSRLDWQTLLPEAVAATGEAVLEGDMNRIEIRHTLSRPFRVTSSGALQLDGAEPRIALSGHWQALRWPLRGPADYASPRGEYRLDGTLDAYTVRLDAPLDVQGAPALQVHLQGQGDRRQLAVETLRIAALDGTLAAHGNVAWAPQFSLGLAIDAAALNPGVAWPAWPGQLAGTTQLEVTGAGEQVNVTLSALDLHGTLRDYPVLARGELHLNGGVPGSTGLQLSSGDNRLELSGRLDANTGLRYRLDATQLSAVMPGLAGRLRADGALKGSLPQLAGSVDLTASGLAYQGNSVGRLALQAQLDPNKPQGSRVNASAEDIRLGATPIERLVLDGEGGIERHRVQLDISAERGDVAIGLHGGYHDAAWTGVLEQATARLGELGDWQLREAVALQADASRLQPFKACWQAPAKDLCLSGSRDNDTVQLAVSGDTAEGHLHGEFGLGPPVDARRPLSGSIGLDVPDLRFLDPLIPEIGIARGAASADIRLGGYLDTPTLSGTARLADGLVHVPELGVEIKNIALQAEGTGTDLALRGSAESGAGDLRLSGSLALDPERAWPFDVRLQGERFTVADRPDMNLQANPDLRAAGSLQGVDLTGSVLIPYARIILKKLPPNVVKVSADEVIVGPLATPVEPPPSGVPVSVNIVARLGDDVHFEGLGLTTNLAGSLNIRSLPTRALIGNGILELKDGRYEGYGQKLTLQRGRLLFAGPLDNPALDIQATRTVGDVTAGLELTGNADAPQTRLFSDPAMSDAEAMSYLVTGKPLGAASSGGESQALAAAAASFGANSPVAQELSQKLGLDLGVQSGATDADTSLTIGRQLSPRLYADYIYGLFNETGALQLVYKLTDHLNLTGQSGAQQSIDLKFSIDRK